MFRPDILFLIPALLIAFIQLKFIWGRLPEARPEETDLQGEYTHLDLLWLNYFVYLIFGVLLLQLVFPILSITTEPGLINYFRIIGYLLILLGFIISYLGLKQLGPNWTGLQEYRIKKGQSLVTSGIFSVVRHPIYLAIILEVLGFELVSNSWLLVPLILLIGYLLNQHIKKEDNLLEQKFGESFISYKRKVKKLIPFVY